MLYRYSLVLVLVFIIAITGIVSAEPPKHDITIEEHGMTLQDLVSLAAAHNPDLSSAYRSLAQAKRNLEGPFTLDAASLSLKGNYSYRFSDEDEEQAEEPTNAGPDVPGSSPPAHGWSGSMDLSIPVIPQLRFGAGLTVPLFDSENDTFPGFAEAADTSDGKDLTGSVSITLLPFAEKKKTRQPEETYQKALTRAAHLERGIFYEVEAVTFGLLLGFKERKAAKETMELKTREYEIVKERYTIDEDTTITDVSDAADTYTEARQEYFTAEQSLLTAKQDFYRTLGIATGTIIVADVSTETVSSLIERRAPYLDAVESMRPGSLSLENLRAELTTLEEDRRQAWSYRPDLSLSASLDIPSTQFGATISYSLSPQDFKTKERKNLEENIEAKKQDITMELFTLDLEKEMAFSHVRTLGEMAELSRSAFKDAQITLDETRLLFEQGERTELELVQAETTVYSAEIKYFAALCSLYQAQAAVLRLFPDRTISL